MPICVAAARRHDAVLVKGRTSELLIVPQGCPSTSATPGRRTEPRCKYRSALTTVKPSRAEAARWSRRRALTASAEQAATAWGDRSRAGVYRMLLRPNWFQNLRDASLYDPTERSWLGPVGTGSHLPAPRSEPGVQISRTGLPRTDRSRLSRWSDPRLCHSRDGEFEPRPGAQRRPIAASLCLLTTPLQRPRPSSTDSLTDAV
jgi:hypothetical protein